MMAESGDNSKKIMIAVDGSEQAEHAFDFYVSNVHQPGNKLLLVHSAEPPDLASHQAIYMSGELWAEMSAKEEAKVKALKQKYKHKMAEAKLEGAIRSTFSSKPGETIVTMAHNDKVDMIVVGTRGMGTIRRTILGSVSDYIVHHANCPVVVCRSGHPAS